MSRVCCTRLSRVVLLAAGSTEIGMSTAMQQLMLRTFGDCCVLPKQDLDAGEVPEDCIGYPFR